MSYKQRLPTPLGNALSEYLQIHNMQQQALADLLSVDLRTLKRWLAGDNTPRDIHEINRIAILLGLDPESLIASILRLPLTPEQVDAAVLRTWALIDAARITEARNLIERVVFATTPTDNIRTLKSLVHAYHATALATSFNVRTAEVSQAIYYYNRMEQLARRIGDDSQVAIALSYQGDMWRRAGDFKKAIEYLESARDTTPRADAAARGNGIQLLGRTYFGAERLEPFEYALAQATDLALSIKDKKEENTVAQFYLGTVYEEYGKSYGRLGKVTKALEYVDLAEKARPNTKTSEILMKIARAEILIRNGDLQEGEPLAVEAAIYSRDHGHYRRLERISALRRYMSQQITKYSKTEAAISNAIDGPTEA